MTRDESLTLSYKFVKDAIVAFVAARGYKKNSTTIWKDLGDVRYIIDLQKSQRSNSNNISFTLNFSIVVKPLLEMDGLLVQKMRAIDGHLRWRAGDFLDPTEDKWWGLNLETQPQEIVEEISTLLSEIILPRFEGYSSVQSIIDLLQSEHHPPLSEKARTSLLNAVMELK